jgi:hypothetical protein
MRVTLSERQFTEQIRSLEGIGPEVTTEEICHRIDKHAKKLFEHLTNYGVSMLREGFRLNGTLATIQASLSPSYSEEDVETRINGLAMLAPVSVSLDQPDLPAFVTNKVMLAGMSDNWMAFGGSLQRLTLPEVRDALEKAALQIVSAPVAPPSNAFEQEMFDAEYQAFLAIAGKRDPLSRHNAVDEFNRQEAAAVKAAQQKATEEVWANRGE